MNTRQKTKGGTYINRHSSLVFTSQTSAISATEQNWNHLAFLARYVEHSFVGQCSRWHCSKRSASSRSYVMVERIDVSVRYNLAKTRSDSDIVTISVQMISTQQPVDVSKLDTATIAECCRSIVRALFKTYLNRENSSPKSHMRLTLTLVGYTSMSAIPVVAP